MKRIIILIVSIISVSGWSLFAQGIDMKTEGQGGVGLKKTGQTTMNFLQIGVSPKASGLGAAYTSLSRGVESIFANPAGLTEMTSQFEAFVSSTQWFADIKYLSGALAWNADEWGAFGFSFVIVDYGSITQTTLIPSTAAGTDPLGYTKLGEVKNVGAYSIGFSYVRQISTKFSIGGTAKYVGQQLGQVMLTDGLSDIQKHTWAFDMGVKYFTGIESLRLGMSMRNFSTPIYYQSASAKFTLPMTFAVGLGMNIMDLINKDMSKEHQLMLSAEFVHPNNYTDRICTGFEYTFSDMVSLRAGYETNHDVLSWAGGVGVKQSIGGILFDINYSYSDTEYFDGVNRFSINIAF